MKFTAFVLATAAASASAQFNPFLQGQQLGGVTYQPYPVQQAQPLYNPYPIQQPLYPVQQPVAQDPLAWERDCTWVNAIDFRNKLSLATCGKTNCAEAGGTPNGNGGGNDRKIELWPSNGIATSPNGDQYHVWGSVINRAGRVCAVAYTGKYLDSQFPFGRIQAMKRANTANSLSLPTRAMPSHVTDRHNFIDNVDNGHPGDADNGWYGFSHDRFNPGNVDVQFQGATASYGEACGSERQDPMCMQKPGGMDYSAGGLALYDSNNFIRGAIGVAGDNDCASHAIAWKTRTFMKLHFTPVNKARPTFNDNAICVQFAGAALTVAAADGMKPRRYNGIGTNSVNSDVPAFRKQINMNTQTANGFGGSLRFAPLGRANFGTGWDLWGDSAEVKCSTQANNNEVLTTAVVPLRWPPSLPAAGTTQVSRAHWAHTGNKAEDNVYFTTREWRNFPACYYLIRRFQIDHPTAGAK